MDEEPVSRCGYCAEVIDYCQGHGDEERAAYGFEIDSDEYAERRERFEAEADGVLPDLVIDGVLDGVGVP